MIAARRRTRVRLTALQGRACRRLSHLRALAKWRASQGEFPDNVDELVELMADALAHLDGICGFNADIPCLLDMMPRAWRGIVTEGAARRAMAVLTRPDRLISDELAGRMARLHVIELDDLHRLGCTQITLYPVDETADARKLRREARKREMAAARQRRQRKRRESVVKSRHASSVDTKSVTQLNDTLRTGRTAAAILAAIDAGRSTVADIAAHEADAMLPGAEGSPIALAEKRTLSFPNRKIIIGSTPTDEDTSNVLRSYGESDKRVFEVPCPHCGHRFELLWCHIHWPEGAPEKAHAVCPANGCVIEEREKSAMVAAGGWRATAPEVHGHAGFRLNALVSLLPNASWGKLAAEFLAAKDDADLLRVFANTILAEGWREAADAVDESALASRVEPFSLNAIPAEVLAITVGVDVQDDRLECTFVGWTRDDAALVLDHAIVWGSSQDDSTWTELDEMLRSTWKHPHGGRLKIDAAVVDSGDGGITEKVYSFCFPRLSRRIWAGKGVSGPRQAFQMSKSPVRGGRLFLVGVDGIKATLFDRLKRSAQLRFSAGLDAAYFAQLASERRVVRYVKGQPVRRFERIPGARAETLDCLVYAFAARRGVPLNFDQREDELRGAPAAPRQARVIPPSFPRR